MNCNNLYPNKGTIYGFLISVLLTTSSLAADWKTNEVVLIPVKKEDNLPTTESFRVVMLVTLINEADQTWQVLDLYMNSDSKADWHILSNRQQGFEDSAKFIRIPVCVSTADWDDTLKLTNKPFINNK